MSNYDERLLAYEKMYLDYEDELLFLIAYWLRQGLDEYELGDNIEQWKTEQLLKTNNANHEIINRHKRLSLIEVVALVSVIAKKEKETLLKQADEYLEVTDNENKASRLKDVSNAIEQASRQLMIEQVQYQQQANKTILDNLDADYKEILNEIAKEVVSGRKTIFQATHEVTRKFAERGLTVLKRRDGAKLSVEGYVSSSLRAIQKTVAIQLQEQTYDELGIDLVETTSLADSRITHIPFQAKVYSRSGTSLKYPPLASTGYGTITGMITGINCRHQMYPFDEVTGQRFKPFSEKGTAQNYRLSQKQRKFERNIRRAKKELQMLENLNAPADQIATAKVKLQRRQAKMQEFIENTGRRRRPEREKSYAR